MLRLGPPPPGEGGSLSGARVRAESATADESARCTSTQGVGSTRPSARGDRLDGDRLDGDRLDDGPDSVDDAVADPHDAVAGAVFVEYVHVRAGSCRVAAGDRVAAGQTLCESGDVGFCPSPHLHLQVHRSSAPKAPTVPFSLVCRCAAGPKAGAGTLGAHVPQAGLWYAPAQTGLAGDGASGKETEAAKTEHVLK
jgi:hypothetical protein